MKVKSFGEIVLALLIGLMIYSCSNPLEEDEAEQERIRQDSIEQANLENELIDQYIIDNELSQYEITVTDTGLRYITLDEGPGDKFPELNDILSVDYIGSFLDNEIFDTSIYDVAEENDMVSSSNPYTPITYTFNGSGIGSTFVPGFKEGLHAVVPGLSLTGRGLLILPSPIAYGSFGSNSGTIPPNTVIVFEVRLSGIRP